VGLFGGRRRREMGQFYGKRKGRGEFRKIRNFSFLRQDRFFRKFLMALERNFDV
jgi:hypothetical protein